MRQLPPRRRPGRDRRSLARRRAVQTQYRRWLAIVSYRTAVSPALIAAGRPDVPCPMSSVPELFLSSSQPHMTNMHAQLAAYGPCVQPSAHNTKPNIQLKSTGPSACHTHRPQLVESMLPERRHPSSSTASLQRRVQLSWSCSGAPMLSGPRPTSGGRRQLARLPTCCRCEFELAPISEELALGTAPVPCTDALC